MKRKSTSAKRGSKKRSRPKDAKGHFLSNAAIARKRSAKKARHASPKTAPRRVAKKAPHAKRKTARRAARVVHHHHASPPRKRRTASRRAIIREEIAALYERSNPGKKTMKHKKKKNPVPMGGAAYLAPKKSKKKHPKKASAPKRRHTSGSKKRTAARRRAATRSRTAFVPAVVRRKTSKGRTRAKPAAVKIQILTGRAPSAHRAKKGGSKRKKNPIRRKTRSSRTLYGRRRKTTGRFYESRNPLMLGAGAGGAMSEYGLSNPLSSGELAVAVVSVGFGIASASLLDRYLATRVPDKGPKLENGTATDTAPGWLRIGAQTGLGALPIIGSYFVHQPMVKAGLQGAGLGAFAHLFGQLLTHFVFMKIFKNESTSLGSRLYSAEYTADAAAKAIATGGKVGGYPGLSAHPGYAYVGAPPNQRFGPRPMIQDIGPRAGVSGPIYGMPAGNVGQGSPCDPRNTPTDVSAALVEALNRNAGMSGAPEQTNGAPVRKYAFSDE